MACHGEVEIIQGKQNIAENYTPVTVNFYCVRDSGYAYSGYETYAWCILDGTGQTITVPGFDISASNPRILIGSITKNIYHNPDGKRTVSASFSWDSKNSYVGTITGERTLPLPTIPRASSITATEANIGSASTIIINRATPSFTHTVTYSFGALSGTIATRTAETVIGWNIPTSFYTQIPNAQYGVGSITCTTYSGDTAVGSKTTQFTATVPISSKPTIDNVTIVDTNAKTIALTGSNKRLVSYCSNVKITAVAKILNYAKFGSLKENNNPMTKTESVNGGTTTVTGNIDYANNSRTAFSIRATDSRGLASDERVLNQENGSFTVVPYIPLKISAEFARIAPTIGEVGLKFSGNFYNGSFDVENTKFNTLVLKWRYKPDGGEWVTNGADDTINGWRNLKLGTDYKYGTDNIYYSGNSSLATIISLGRDYNYKNKYVFELYYSDKIEEHVFTQPVKQGEPCFDFGKDRNGNNYFWVNGDLYAQNGNKVLEYETIETW